MTSHHTHKVHLNEAAGTGQGYPNRTAIICAANRAMRWVRQPRNQGHKPPRHIADKMLLIRVTNDA